MFFFLSAKKKNKKENRGTIAKIESESIPVCAFAFVFFFGSTLRISINKRGNNRLTVSAKKSRRGCGFRRISYCGQDTAANQGLLKEDLYRLGLFSMLFLHFNAM